MANSQQVQWQSANYVSGTMSLSSIFTVDCNCDSIVKRDEEFLKMDLLRKDANNNATLASSESGCDEDDNDDDDGATITEPSYVPQLLAHDRAQDLTKELHRLTDRGMPLESIGIPITPHFIDGSKIEPVCRNGNPVQLGSGCFGTVFLGSLLAEDGRKETTLVAVKFIKKKAASIDEIVKEAAFCSYLSNIHGNPCPYFFGLAKIESSDRFHNIALVSEFVGDDLTLKSLTLYKLLRQCKLARQKSEKPPAADSALVAILLHILDALASIHNRSVYVNDLKADNVLLRKEAGGWCTYIVDLGHATYGHNRARCDLGHMSEQAYLAEYRQVAPETVRTGECTAASDIYSFGNILRKVYGNMTMRYERMEQLIEISRWDDPVQRPSSLWLAKELKSIYNMIANSKT